MERCGVCRVRPALAVITVVDTRGRRHRVYACGLCHAAFQFGYR